MRKRSSILSSVSVLIMKTNFTFGNSKQRGEKRKEGFKDV